MYLLIKVVMMYYAYLLQTYGVSEV